MRKKEIFRAIIEIIDEKGVSHLSTTEIAKKVGISQPAIYKHFKNKDELILYFIDELKNELKNIINHANKGRNLIEKIKRLYEAHLNFVESNKVIPRIVFSDEIHDIKTDKKRIKFKEVCFDYYRGEIVKIFLESGIKKEKAYLYSQIILGTFIIMTLNWMLNGMNYKLNSEIPSFVNFWKEILNLK